MFVVNSYFLAVILCIVTMVCWGSWANTQKMASREWSFQLFYWDFGIGLFLFSLLLAFTFGSFGAEGRSFIPDLLQGTSTVILWAILGGIILNLGNIFFVGAIDIAGMAVAFPICIGLALVIGVVQNYIAIPTGNFFLLFLGVLFVVIAIIVDAFAYRRIPTEGKKGHMIKSIILSILGGIGIGAYYRFLQFSMARDFINPEAGKLTPYTVVVLFSFGVFISNFLWNSIVMKKPFTGSAIPFIDYFKKGNPKLHLIGIFGGIIWSIGIMTNMLASGTAGPAISYGLGQGATMVGALWGVFIWKEFKKAPTGTNKLLVIMFILYVIGLLSIISANLV